jgi:hypothetical protein
MDSSKSAQLLCLHVGDGLYGLITFNTQSYHLYMMILLFWKMVGKKRKLASTGASGRTKLADFQTYSFPNLHAVVLRIDGGSESTLVWELFKMVSKKRDRVQVIQ